MITFHSTRAFGAILILAGIFGMVPTEGKADKVDGAAALTMLAMAPADSAKASPLEPAPSPDCRDHAKQAPAMSPVPGSAMQAQVVFGDVCRWGMYYCYLVGPLPVGAPCCCPAGFCGTASTY